MGTRARRTPSLVDASKNVEHGAGAAARRARHARPLLARRRDDANHPARSGQVEPAPLRRQKHVGQDVDLALGLGPLGLRHARASAAILGIDFHFLQHRDARASFTYIHLASRNHSKARFLSQQVTYGSVISGFV